MTNFNIIEKNKEFWVYDNSKVLRYIGTKKECDKWVKHREEQIILSKRNKGKSIFSSRVIKELNKISREV